MPFADVMSICRETSAANTATVTVTDDWLLKHAVNYWSGPESLPLWLPPHHEGFMARSNSAAKAARMVLRPWQETLVDTLADERTRGLDRPRKAGLSPATEQRLVDLLRSEGGG